MSLWVIGAGPMAQDYAKVLASLGHDFEVIGRSAASAVRFETTTGRAVRQDGLRNALAASKAPELAIVAVGVEQLASAATDLIEAGTRRVLVEKPGGLNTAEIGKLRKVAERARADVLIGYNRRFYASAALARRLITEDGGPVSCIFEFTEWSHVIAPLTKASGVKEAWFTSNSTHVVDLAFHFCGFPREWRPWHGGSLAWHPAAARFCGAGITDRGVFFSYHADWEAPGRWSLEVLTRKRRFVFRPMEQLQVVKLGSVALENVPLDDQLDKSFKPGLHEQTKAFVARNDRLLCTLDEQLRHCIVYDQMAGYGHPESIAVNET
jgi:hypothetical protein